MKNPNDKDWYYDQHGIFNTGANSRGTNGGVLPEWTLTQKTHGNLLAAVRTLSLPLLIQALPEHPDLQANMWVNDLENGEPGMMMTVMDLSMIFTAIISSTEMAHQWMERTWNSLCRNYWCRYNDVGIKGMMKNVRLTAVRLQIMQERGTVSDAIAAIDYAIKNGAHVLSNSGPEFYSQALFDGVEPVQKLGFHLSRPQDKDNDR